MTKSPRFRRMVPPSDTSPPYPRNITGSGRRKSRALIQRATVRILRGHRALRVNSGNGNFLQRNRVRLSAHVDFTPRRRSRPQARSSENYGANRDAPTLVFLHGAWAGGDVARFPAQGGGAAGCAAVVYSRYGYAPVGAAAGPHGTIHATARPRGASRAAREARSPRSRSRRPLGRGSIALIHARRRTRGPGRGGDGPARVRRGLERAEHRGSQNRLRDHRPARRKLAATQRRGQDFRG